MSYRVRIAALLTLALAVPVLGAGPAQAAPDTTDNKIQVVQHNPDMNGPAPAMQAAADWGGVDALTFQELCKSQLAELRAAGYTVKWRKQRARTDSTCRKGNAIATTRTFGTVKTYPLITRGSGGQKRKFTLLCADLKGTGVSRTTVCTSHFPLDYNDGAPPSGTQNRVTVADKIRSILGKKINAGRRVVLTGDFNDEPRSAPLDRLYRAGGSGRFWEGDQECGKALCRDMAPTTTNPKRKANRIDYFFASSPGVNPRSGVSKLPIDPRKADPPEPYKGHFVIRGSVKFGRLG